MVIGFMVAVIDPITVNRIWDLVTILISGNGSWGMICDKIIGN